MRRRIFFSIGILLLLGSAFLAARELDTRGTPLFEAQASLPFDYSIKTEQGAPIMVRRVIDGDTIELINGERLRYIGIDTPEEVDPRKSVQCFAREAAEKNKELVLGKMIIFHKDVSTKDQYGRWLGFVYLADGTFVNLELVKQGFAFSYPYPPDISKANQFRTVEAEARKSSLGLWAGCRTYQTKNGRSQTNALN